MVQAPPKPKSLWVKAHRGKCYSCDRVRILYVRPYDTGQICKACQPKIDNGCHQSCTPEIDTHHAHCPNHRHRRNIHV